MTSQDTFEDLFHSFKFDSRSIEIMHNWEAINECEDERDAERIRKRSETTKQLLQVHKDDLSGLDLDSDLPLLSTEKQVSKREIYFQEQLSLLKESHWLDIFTADADVMLKL
jgi:hypothetical protein